MQWIRSPLTIVCVSARLCHFGDGAVFILSTGSLHNYSLERVFGLARRVGFDGIEVIIDSRWDTRQAEYLRLVSSAQGLPVVSLHAPLMPGIQGWEEDPLTSLQRTVELARALEVGIVVAHLPMRWHWLSVQSSLFKSRRFRMPLFWPQGRGYARWLQQNREQLCGNGNGVQVLLENMPAHRLFGVRFNLYALNDTRALSGFGGVVLDTTHLGTWGSDVLAVYEQLKPRIKHVHLSDYDGREHRSPGTGHLPLAQLLERMASDGYKGCIVVESGPEHLAAGQDVEVERSLGQALAFCQQYFQRTSHIRVADRGG
jgi:sugar phosphate isomerase/epimerase